MTQRDFPHASIIEGLRFTGQVAVPNVIGGLFRRRRSVTAVIDKVGLEGLSRSFIAGLRRSYGDGPLWVRLAKDEALLALGREAITHVLRGSPEPFAADPEPKRSAMNRFQPDALTISRHPEWEDRRRFTEAVLDTGKPVHRLGDRFAVVCGQEAAALPNELDWESWNAAVRRATRRIILGEAAAHDDRLSQTLAELMDKSNPPGRGDPALLDRYTAALERYVEAAEPESLVGLFGQAPSSPMTKPARQVTHWLFALGDTLAIHALRCLVLLAAHDEERERTREEIAHADLDSGLAIGGLDRLEACLQEAMRLWPTTAMLSRETVHASDWDGVEVPAGTQVLIVNTFNHRDRDEVAFADHFAPEQWVTGTAGDDWLFNHLSHGPQGCPGADLALFVGKAMLARLLRERDVTLLEPALDPARPLPESLDFFGIRLGLAPRA